MSIPERLWRLAKGYLSVAEEQLRGPEHLQSQADAYGELADLLRLPTPSAPAPDEPSVEQRVYQPLTSAAPAAIPRSTSVRQPGTGRDPLDACYALLGTEPGCQLADVDRAYEARLAELHPEQYPAGSVERTRLDAQRGAVSAAYERLRDALNPTETRFEHIEF